MKKYFFIFLVSLTIILIVFGIYKMNFYSHTFNEGGDRGSKILHLHSFVSKFESAENRKPTSTNVSEFLKQFKDFQFDKKVIYTGFVNDYFVINIRTLTAILNEWESEKSEISNINFDTMYEEYSSLSFLFSDQSSFTLYVN